MMTSSSMLPILQRILYGPSKSCTDKQMWINVSTSSSFAIGQRTTIMWISWTSHFLCKSITINNHVKFCSAIKYDYYVRNTHTIYCSFDNDFKTTKTWLLKCVTTSQTDRHMLDKIIPVNPSAKGRQHKSWTEYTGFLRSHLFVKF